MVIATDKDNNLVVNASYRRGVDDWVYELPSGWIETGESAEQAAERELLEETGYFAEVEIIGTLYPQPSFSSMLTYVALAKIDSAKQDKQRLDHDEDIKCELIRLDEIKEMIKNNQIKDMGFLAALQIASQFLENSNA